MKDKPHVRLVDAHAEGDRRADDHAVVLEKFILVARPHLMVEPRVIGERAPPGQRKLLRELLRAPPRCAIDDAALALMRFEPLGELARRIGLGPHRQKQVRTVEGAHENARTSREQACDNVGAGGAVGGGRHRDRLHAAERIGDLAQPQIFGAKIMPPLRDAMGLVDRKKIDLGASEQLDHVVAHQALGRDIEQAQRAIAHRRRDAPAFVDIGSRIQRRRRNSELAQLRDLVAHQRDQRRDHQGEAFARQRRQLIAERFAAARRHDRQHILAAQRRADDFLLAGAKAGEAEDAAELGAGFVEKGFARHAPSFRCGSKTGVHCTSSMRSAPQASMTSRSSPSAAPLAAGMESSAVRKSSSMG